MPTFDFGCEQCGKVMEEVYLLSEKVPETIPCSCGGTRKKQIGSPALHFIGRGWPSKDVKNRRKS